MLCDEFCTEINITLSFTTCKIGSFFSTKSKAPSNLESFVVYKYICAGCSASYIGETTRHLWVRINEHLKTDKQSQICKHLNQNTTCKGICNETCFSKLDSASTKFVLKLKEAIHIEWFKPTLNKQKKTDVKLTINV